MSDIKSSINYIYRINDYKFFSFDDFYESYGFNILIQKTMIWFSKN